MEKSCSESSERFTEGLASLHLSTSQNIHMRKLPKDKGAAPEKIAETVTGAHTWLEKVLVPTS